MLAMIVLCLFTLLEATNDRDYERLACHYVPHHSYGLADGSGIEYAYGSLAECFEKCDADPQCLGFLDRSPEGTKICAWKSNEETLQQSTVCQNDYYRKPNSMIYRVSNNVLTDWRPAVPEVHVYSDSTCTTEIDATYEGSSGGFSSATDGSKAFDGSDLTSWRPNCHPCAIGEAWLSFSVSVEIKCVEALYLGEGSGGSATWNGGIKVEKQNSDGTWTTEMESTNGNSASKSEGIQRYEYVGCYNSGWTRPSSTDVPITAEGVQTCRGICNDAGFQYFGFECPHANGDEVEVHCECSNSINSDEKVDDQMCQEFNVNSGGHCVGPFVVETSIGTYYLGAPFMNSGYKVSESVASYCSRFPVEIADLSGDLSSCNNCQYRDCVLECDCGRGKTSINIKDKCTDTTITVKGGALVCKEKKYREISEFTGCKYITTVPDFSISLTRCADLASQDGFPFFTHGPDADGDIHCAFYTECQVATYGSTDNAQKLYDFIDNGYDFIDNEGFREISDYSDCKWDHTALSVSLTDCAKLAVERGFSFFTHGADARGIIHCSFYSGCNVAFYGSTENDQKLYEISHADAYKEVGGVGEMLSIQGQCNSNELGHENCREKSTAVFEAPKPSDSSDFNGLLWSFGQFVDHDLDFVDEVKTDIVDIPYDAGTTNVNFEFHRARSDCPNGEYGNRRNTISARIDLSQVYGSTKQQEDNLRDPNNRAKMKISEDVLPSDDKTIFLCGDARCGENPFLTSQHTLWVKHHNVIVDELKEKDNTLSGDILYEAAKEINVATYQRIVDREFLPALVGPTPAAKYWRTGDWISHVHDSAKISIGSLYLNENEGGVTLDLCREMVFGLHACKKQYLSHGSNGECVCATVEGYTFLPAATQWKTYEINKDVICPSQGDMSISSLFANAAYRLHHLVNDEFFIDDKKNFLKKHFFDKESFAKHGKLDSWFERLLEQKSHKFGNHMAESLQHALFSGPDKDCDESSKKDCRDLAALNCLRGIDVGLPTYNEVRKMFGLPQREDFEWSENACGTTLADLYNWDIDQVELFMGGSCEEPVSGAVLGETFLVIVKDQFLRLRDNDPNWIAYKAPAEYTYSEVIKRCTNLRNKPELFHGQASFLHKDTPVYVTVTTGICPDYYSPLTDLDECKNTLPGMMISNRIVTSFAQQGCRSWWTPAGTCFVFANNNKSLYTAKTCEVTNPSYHNHQLVCKFGFPTPPQKPTQGKFLLEIEGLQGEKENFINKRILDQDTLKISEK